jgi:hypothetical protein
MSLLSNTRNLSSEGLMILARYPEPHLKEHSQGRKEDCYYDA